MFGACFAGEFGEEEEEEEEAAGRSRSFFAGVKCCWWVVKGLMEEVVVVVVVELGAGLLVRRVVGGWFSRPWGLAACVEWDGVRFDVVVVEDASMDGGRWECAEERRAVEESLRALLRLDDLRGAAASSPPALPRRRDSSGLLSTWCLTGFAGVLNDDGG